MTWIPIADAERMLLELYDISEGKAKNLVRKALESGDVQQRPPPQSELVSLTQDDGLIDFDMTPGAIESFTWPERRLHKNDLLCWAKDQGLPQKQASAVDKGPDEAPARFSMARIKAMAVEYKEQLNGAPPSRDRFIEFARGKYGFKGYRDGLRAAYKELFPNRQRGRPFKK